MTAEYPCISFTRDKNKVRARVSLPSLPNEVVFELAANTENHAALLSERLRYELSEQMRRVKQAAYNKGWDDKAKRRRKQTHFYGDLDHRSESL